MQEWADAPRPGGFVVLGAFDALVIEIFAEPPAFLQKDVAKASRRLAELQGKLAGRAAGLIKGGRPPTLASVSQKCRSILHRQYLKDVIRVTIEDVAIGDTVIPSGSFVQVLIAALNRDPQKFDDPDCFDITRTTRQHLAFGHGSHFCLGSHLARMEAQTAVGRLLQAYPEIALACEPQDIPWVSTVIRGAQSMPARLTRGA